MTVRFDISAPYDVEETDIAFARPQGMELLARVYRAKGLATDTQAAFLIQRFEGRAPFAIAVFTSAGCALCRALEPSLRLVANDPEVELELFDEQVDAEAWSSLAIPGSPYAVVLGRDGEVLAKGTFNSLFQLESLIAHATGPVGA